VAAFSQSDWVAEQPEIHLRPHVEAWCQRDQRLALVGENTNDGLAYVLDLEWRGANRGVGEARAAVFPLIGSFAESATYVRQRRVNGEGSTTKFRFEVGTGELAPDARFVPHGHLVPCLSGRDGADMLASQFADGALSSGSPATRACASRR
jgi:hypothetical protein